MWGTYPWRGQYVKLSSLKLKIWMFRDAASLEDSISAACADVVDIYNLLFACAFIPTGEGLSFGTSNSIKSAYQKYWGTPLEFKEDLDDQSIYKHSTPSKPGIIVSG